MDQARRERLQLLAAQFLRQKTLTPLGGLELDPGQRLQLAALCCLPLLEFGQTGLRGWSQLLVYPEAFRVRRSHVDAAGVLHEWDDELIGEAGDLQELLGNLLENAFKWARHRVLLTARPDRAAPNRRAGLQLVVEDDGPGIEPDDVARVLQRGVRGDERVQGHGIGLSIVQDLVRDYRGELQVARSQELGGARFEVTLPPGL